MRIADDDRPRLVAGPLGEDPRRRGVDERPAQAAREADAHPVGVGAGGAEDVDRLGVVDDLDADLFEQRVRVVLDGLEALGRDDLDRRELAGQVRERLQPLREPLGLSGRTSAPHPGVLDVVDFAGGHRWLLGGGPDRSMVAMRGSSVGPTVRGGGPARGPRRTPGSPASGRRSRPPRGRRLPAAVNSRARPSTTTAVSAMTSESACEVRDGRRSTRHGSWPRRAASRGPWRP